MTCKLLIDSIFLLYHILEEKGGMSLFARGRVMEFEAKHAIIKGADKEQRREYDTGKTRTGDRKTIDQPTGNWGKSMDIQRRP